MMSRIEWLKLQMRYGRPEKLPLILLIFLGFEAFYQFCTLRGYRPRHALLDPPPESVRNMPQEERRILLIWPHLPLAIRVLEKICPYANGSHAEFVPYSVEAEAKARAAGLRFAVVEKILCEPREWNI